MAKQLKVGEEVTIRAKYHGLLQKIYSYPDAAAFEVKEIINGYGGGAKKAVRVEWVKEEQGGAGDVVTFFTWPVMLDRTAAQAQKNAQARKADALAGKIGTDARMVEGLIAAGRAAGLKGVKGKKEKRAALNKMVEEKLASGTDETAA